MTTIAWDGKILAADKLVVGSNLFNVTKIFKINNNCVIGMAGNTCTLLPSYNWVKEGCHEEKWPLKNEDENNVYILKINSINNKFEIILYENTPFPMIVENNFFAIGSGSQYAFTAMYLHKNAIEAVKIAAKLDNYTGNQIDYFEFKNYEVIERG